MDEWEMVETGEDVAEGEKLNQELERPWGQWRLGQGT